MGLVTLTKGQIVHKAMSDTVGTLEILVKGKIKISDSYSSKENEMIYGNKGGVCYGIAVYASTRWGEANSYAGGQSSHVMNLVLDKTRKTMRYDTICQIRSEVVRRRDTLVQKVEQLFLKHGIEPTRANDMARSFGITLGDEGFIAMLLGVDWYDNGSTYNMIENLGALCRCIG